MNTRIVSGIPRGNFCGVPVPFVEMIGTSVTYNWEAALPAATFYDVGDAWTEVTSTFTQKTATLKILGGDADVDNTIQATYGDPNAIEAEFIANRAKSVAYKSNEGFIPGVKSTFSLRHFDT